MPVCEARALGRGVATVEEYLPPGERRFADNPEVRRLIAVGLAEHMARLAHRTNPELPIRDKLSPNLFPQPHSKLFNPSEADTVWVREIATRARELAVNTPSPLRIGHCDWRVEHVGFDGDELVSSYDWDSLRVAPEIQIVGTNARGHTADWTQSEYRRVPPPESVVGFIDDYSAARETPLTEEEKRGARAWAVYGIAYGAWITIAPGETSWPEDSYAALLQEAGESLLA